MNDEMTAMEALKVRVAELEAENACLKALLDKAGISYTGHSFFQGEESHPSQKAQGARILSAEISKERANRFFSFFWGRKDVYSLRYQNKKTGKAGYYPQCRNFWRRGVCPKTEDKKAKCRDCRYKDWKKLTIDAIQDHLSGSRADASDVIGVYPLFPDGTCRFLVFDFDNHEEGAEQDDYANRDEQWREEVDALRIICSQNQIPALVERSRSGRGAHVWFFFDGPVDASLARRFGYALLDKGAESVNLKSFRFYDRMLPAQDMVSSDGLGNLIALPLQGLALKEGNSAFVDEEWNAYPDQWGVLLSMRRLSGKALESWILEWTKDNGGDRTKNEPQADPVPEDGTKPWEKNRAFHREDLKGNLQIVLGNRIYVKTENLSPRIQNQIRRLAAFGNPVFYKNNAIGLSNYANSRYIYLGEDKGGYICIPRGLLETLEERCRGAGIALDIEDRRSPGRPINVSFTGELRGRQEEAVRILCGRNTGILSAATAFGKTVACCGIIAEKKTSTLILLESSALIEQWERALESFLDVKEEPPLYKTRTGREKRRKSVIGLIQGPKDTSTGIIDIAMAGSLRKKGEFHPRLSEYGLVIMDECHHSASDTVRAVLEEVEASHVYGVTATPFRGDGLEKINYMLLGPVRFRYTAREKALEQGIAHLVRPRFTRVVSPHGREKLHVNDAYEILRESRDRNDMIEADVRSCIASGRTPVVLTRYTEHASVLYERVRDGADHVFLLTGKKSKKEQRELREEMEKVPREETMILIATGQLIGEGFDYPRLDTLIMAMPVAFKGLVEQYAGRLNRDYDGKENVLVYDYVDRHIPVFDRMYAKRLKAYKRIGYQIFTEGVPDKQTANAIFDAETYAAVYEKDLMEASEEIVISSPTLSAAKVRHLTDLLKERQEAGVRITVVTWHPDAYRYGKDEHRIELMETLRDAGFHLELMEDACEHYAVMDSQIVWYGSMNLLSKEDAEDNIMRVASREIAAELLEMTFRKGSKLQEYTLPL